MHLHLGKEQADTPHLFAEGKECGAHWMVYVGQFCLIVFRVEDRVEGRVLA